MKASVKTCLLWSCKLNLGQNMLVSMIDQAGNAKRIGAKAVNEQMMCKSNNFKKTRWILKVRMNKSLMGVYKKTTIIKT